MVKKKKEEEEKDLFCDWISIGPKMYRSAENDQEEKIWILQV